MKRSDFLKATGSLVALSVLGAAGCGSDDSSDGGAAGSGDAGAGGGSGSGGSGGSSGGSGGSNGGSGGSTGGSGGSTGGSGGSTGGSGGSTGGSGGSGGSSSQCAKVDATIANNHGHVLTVSEADVKAAADKTYDIMGTSPHTHSVTVKAADFATLASGGTPMLVSTTGANHTHMITVKCA